MLELSERKGDLYLDELRDFLLDKHNLNISVSALSKWIQRVEWSTKKSARIASKRNDHLRSRYAQTLRSFTPHMLVFLEESGADRSVQWGTTSWAPLRSSVLRRSFVPAKGSLALFPAVTCDGLLDCAILPTPTSPTTHDLADAEPAQTAVAPPPTQTPFLFWLKTFLLPKLNPFPSPRSVLVVDADPPEEWARACDAAGVKLVARPPHSPDLNPVELFFIDLDRRLRKHEPAEVEGLEAGMLALLVRQAVEKLGGQQEQFLAYFKRVGVGREWGNGGGDDGTEG